MGIGSTVANLSSPEKDVRSTVGRISSHSKQSWSEQQEVFQKSEEQTRGALEKKSKTDGRAEQPLSASEIHSVKMEKCKVDDIRKPASRAALSPKQSVKKQRVSAEFSLGRIRMANKQRRRTELELLISKDKQRKSKAKEDKTPVRRPRKEASNRESRESKNAPSENLVEGQKTEKAKSKKKKVRHDQWNTSGENPPNVQSKKRKTKKGQVRKKMQIKRDWKLPMLHYAILGGYKKAAFRIIRCMKSEVASVDSDGETALHLASRLGSLEMVHRLVELGGADVNALNNSKRSPLHLAADRGSLSVVQYLLSKGADASQKDADGLTPRDLSLRKKKL